MPGSIDRATPTIQDCGPATVVASTIKDKKTHDCTPHEHLARMLRLAVAEMDHAGHAHVANHKRRSRYRPASTESGVAQDSIPTWRVSAQGATAIRHADLTVDLRVEQAESGTATARTTTGSGKDDVMATCASSAGQISLAPRTSDTLGQLVKGAPRGLFWLRMASQGLAMGRTAW